MINFIIPRQRWFRKNRTILSIAVAAVVLIVCAFFWLAEQNRWFKSDDAQQVVLIEQQAQLDALYSALAAAERAAATVGLPGENAAGAAIAAATSLKEVNIALAIYLANNQGNSYASTLEDAVHRKLLLLRQLAAANAGRYTSRDLAQIKMENAAANDSLEQLQAAIHMQQRNAFLTNRKQLKDKLSSYNTWAYAILTITMLICGLSFYLHSGEIKRRKRISKDLWMKNEQLEITLNSISEGLIAAGVDGKILFMNAAAEALTGWQFADTSSTTFDTVYNVKNEETGLPVDSMLRRVLEQRKQVGLENNTIMMGKGSDPIVISNTGAPVFDDEGNITGAVVVFSDMTEAKKQAIQIKESERKFRTLIESLSEAIYTCDADGYIELYNKAAEELWGRKPTPGVDRWHGSLRTFSANGDLIEEADYPIVKAMKEQRPVYGQEFIIERPDGSRRYVLPSPTPLYNDRGIISGAVNLLIDITDHKQREILVKKTEEKYKNIIEQASDAIIVYDSSGKVYEYNNNVCNLSGYSRQEIEQLNVADIFVGIGDLEPDQYAAMLTGNTLTLCRQLKSKHGYLFDMEIKIRVLQDKKLLAFGRDITARLKDEAKMKLAIERYDFLSQATSDCVWDWNIETDKLIYNDAIETMFGYKGCKINAATPWRESNIHPGDFDRINGQLKNAFARRGQAIHLEYRYRCADGSYKHILDRAFVVYDAKGNPKRIIGAMQDVSLEKEYEQKLAMAIIETQEKERKEISMEMHDNVNQLLSATLLYLGLAVRSIPYEKEVVDLLENCNGYINDAIKDIRRLSHRLTPHAMEDVSMREVFEWLIEPMTVTNQFKINLHMNEYDNDLLSNTIQTHLYRILQEQLSNIIKYARARQVDVCIAVKRCSVEMRIKDDGIGFDAHAARKGIGLKNINSRAQILSGSLDIFTAPGKGCEIVVRVPLEKTGDSTLQ